MRRLCVWRLGRWLPVVQEVRRLCVWRLEADVSNREKMRLVPSWRAIFALRTALHYWFLGNRLEVHVRLAFGGLYLETWLMRC